MLEEGFSRRVEEGFSRLTFRGSEGGRGGGVDQRTFHRHVLEAFPGMPNQVAKLLFDAFDLAYTGGGRREGGRGGPTLAMEDFMCVAAVLLKGTWEQRLRLGFRVYEVMGERERDGNAYRGVSSSSSSSNVSSTAAGAGGQGAGGGAAGGIIKREDVERLLRQVHGWAAQTQLITPAVNLLFTDLSSPSSSPLSSSSSSSSTTSTSSSSSSPLLRSIDFPSFYARLTSAPAFQPTVVGWMEEVLMRVLTDVPSPRLQALDLKYNPEREMKQLAEKYQVGRGGREGEEATSDMCMHA